MGASTSQPRTSGANNSSALDDVDTWTPPVYSGDHQDSTNNESIRNDRKDSASSDDSQEEGQRIADKTTREREMELFHKELAEKRKQRQQMIAAKKGEMQRLKQLADDLTEKNERLERELQALKEEKTATAVVVDERIRGQESNGTIDESNEERLKTQNRSLLIQYAETQLSLQNANSDLLLVTEERDELRKHINSYKDVAQYTKNLLKIRDDQMSELRAKLSEIETSLADRELQWLSNDLKTEYEKQLQDIRNLKTLYEERAKIIAREKIRMKNELEEYKTLLEAQTNKTIESEQRVQELEKDVSDKQSEIRELESQFGLSKAETRSLQQELTVINQLFSQTLLGAGGEHDLDMDRLVLLLEQNRDLLSDMAGTESEATSAMPRMLLDLVSQAQETSESRTPNESISESGEEVNYLQDDKEEDTIGSLDNDNDEIEESSLEEEPVIVENEPRSSEPPKMTTAETIVSRLPKVWRVLMELLSHQTACPMTQDVPEAEQNGPGEGVVPKERGSACYKSVQTPTGPRLVLSVSKTYIRLKDLILEKKSLQKELTRLKQLNSHLETRLGSQQRRLGNVSSELSHTWCLAGRMQRSYRTLHSHEQILRYELQQKRKMLNGLKQELQLCREKWQQAREKNTESEVEWRRLRSEFASRKLMDQQDGCASAESGYSDERSDDSESETRDSTKETDRLTILEEKQEGGPKSHEDNVENQVAPEIVSPWQVLEEDINSARTTLQREGVLRNISESENNSRVERSASVLDNSCTSNGIIDPQLKTVPSAEENAESLQVTNDCDLRVKTDTDLSIPIHESAEPQTSAIGSNRNSLQQNVPTPTHEQSSHHNDVNSEYQATTTISSEIEPSTLVSSAVILNSQEARGSDSTNDQSPLSLDKPMEEPHSSRVSPHGESVDISEQSSSLSSNSGTTSNVSSTNIERSPEEILSARDARLRRLEEQCKQLVSKVTRTSHRSVQLCTRLEELHEQYGRDDPTTNNTIEHQEDLDNAASQPEGACEGGDDCIGEITEDRTKGEEGDSKGPEDEEARDQKSADDISKPTED